METSSQRNRGFTIIEILAVISIIFILSSVAFVNLRDGQKQYALERGVRKLSQDLRRAENLAMSNQPFAGQVPLGGYGIYLKADEKDHYILFADLDGDQLYDAGSDGDVEDIEFEKSVGIQSLSSSPLTITFLPPDPTVNIRPSAQTATIILNNNKTLVINAVGMIEIQ